MSKQQPYPDYADLQANIRANIEQARAQRAAYLGALISGAARAFARRLASYAALLREGYRSEREPARAPAHKTLRKWAGIH